MRFSCTSCRTPLSVPYEWAGMAVTCPACGQETRLEAREGRHDGGSGYAVSFDDFVRLLHVEAWRGEVHPVVARLLGCSVEEHEGRFILRAPDGSVMPYEAAHLRIQGSAASQRELYQLAMSVWR